MKKLQLLALSMLLSTTYIAQASDDSTSSQLSKRQLRRLEKELARENESEMDEENSELDELSPRQLRKLEKEQARQDKSNPMDIQRVMPGDPGHGMMRPAVMPKNGQLQQNENGRQGKEPRLDRAAMKAQALDAIGTPLTSKSISKYSAQLPKMIAHLSENPTRDEMKPVRETLRNVALGLRELGSNFEGNSEQNGNKSRGKDRRKKGSDNVKIQRKDKDDSETTNYETTSPAPSPEVVVVQSKRYSDGAGGGE